MFEPFTAQHGINGLRFHYSTQEAVDWYYPLKPYTLIEYEWVRKHVRIYRSRIIDAGCHHGNYSVLFGGHRGLFCVDANPRNCDITDINLRLNGITGEVLNCAVWNYDGEVLFNGASNGRVGVGNPVRACKLSTICELAEVVKLDVEGSEFKILPDAIDEMKLVHTWIVEVHPTDGDPHALTMQFVNRGWEVLKVDRNIMGVVPYADSTAWTSHATIIARRQ